jgi:hypothetical protein
MFHHWKRVSVAALVIAAALAFTGLQLQARPAAAQAYYSTGTASYASGMSCPYGPGPSCMMTLSSAVAAGATVTVALPDGTTVSFSCPFGCPAGTQFVITTSSGGYAASPSYSYPTYQVPYAYSYATAQTAYATSYAYAAPSYSYVAPTYTPAYNYVAPYAPSYAPYAQGYSVSPIGGYGNGCYFNCLSGISCMFGCLGQGFGSDPDDQGFHFHRDDRRMCFQSMLTRHC